MVFTDKGLDHAYEQVEKFHKTFKHPVAVRPTLPPKERNTKRRAWILEEIDELEEASLSLDIVGMADAYLDIMYFCLGGLVEMGIKPQPLMDIIQEANMSKVWEDGQVHYREDGKVIKPANWVDPATKLAEEIVRQSHK